MSGSYYIKKFRRSNASQEATPLFVIRRPKSGKNLSEIFQVRYTNICKTFDDKQNSIIFVEKLLNNRLEDLCKKDIIISVTHCDKTREIIIVVKGIDKDEPHVCIEKYKQYFSLAYQISQFEASCFIMWKLLFMKFNNGYRQALLERNLIGNTNVQQTSNHFPSRVPAQASAYIASQQQSQFY